MINLQTIKKIVGSDTSILPKNVRELASMYKDLYTLKKNVETAMEKIKPELIEKKVNEYFVDEQMKVVLTAPTDITYLDNKKIIDQIGTDVFIELASISEKSIRDKYGKETGNKIIGNAKFITEEKGSYSVKVGKMTKEDNIQVKPKE